MPGWHAHPDVLLLVSLIAVGYVYALKRVGPRVVHPIERVATRGQVLCFSGGLLVMLASASWPLHDIAEGYLYSAHMVQHILLSLIMPPLLFLGMPAWLLRWALGRPGLAAARFLTKPIIALAAFNGVIAISHIPAVVTLAAGNEAFHFFVHVLLVGTAFMMWSPVLNPLIELPKLSYPPRMLYLFLQSLVPTVPASFLTFGHTVLYHVYERAPVRLFGISALTDQLVAGLIMKLVGTAIIWSFITAYFFKWFSVEQREKVDVLEWNKLQRPPVQVVR
jgi:putative membrane protein